MLEHQMTATQREKILCGMAQLGLALARGEDAATLAGQVNALLCEIQERTEVEWDAMMLDLFCTLLRICQQCSVTRRQFDEVFAKLFKDQGFYSLEIIQKIYSGVRRLRTEAISGEAVEALYEDSAQVGAGTLLYYLARRDLLNILLRSDVFTEHQSNVERLVSDLGAFPDSAKLCAESVGGMLGISFPDLEETE